uniref:Uncharacterized protein n=1 Tax=Anguilla anguilla TaxID=7936 RepID=A0A0E9WD41_ANGAN
MTVIVSKLRCPKGYVLSAKLILYLSLLSFQENYRDSFLVRNFDSIRNTSFQKKGYINV